MIKNNLEMENHSISQGLKVKIQEPTKESKSCCGGK